MKTNKKTPNQPTKQKTHTKNNTHKTPLVLISHFPHSLAIITISDKAQLFARTMIRKDRLQTVFTVHHFL